MRKPERVSWKDTNMAMVGSDLDHKIKEAAAKHEPQWIGAGDTEMLQVWRIEQFIVKPWPRKKYGQFHTGDSYVVLNTYKPDPTKPKLAYDIHIWIGDESTQDEYGTAAYKMVELDDKLHGAAVQHREVQGKESDKFAKYFNYKIIILKGGVESGFTHVEPSKEEPHLYRLKGVNKTQMTLTQLPVRRDQMNAGDVFVLVAGEDHVWLWIGAESNTYEKTKGMEVARAFCKKGNVIVLDQGKTDGEGQCSDFWAYMPATVSSLGVFTKKLDVQAADDKDAKVAAFVPTLFRLPDASGGSISKVTAAKPVASGPTGGTTSPKIPRTELKPNHGYLLDTGFHAYIWLGNKANKHTKVYASAVGSSYFKSYKRPELPVTLLKANQETREFNDFFYDPPESAACACIIL